MTERIYRLAQPLHPSLKPGELLMFRHGDRTQAHLAYGTDCEAWFSTPEQVRERYAHLFPDDVPVSTGWCSREAWRAQGHEIIGTFLGHPRGLGGFPRRDLARVRPLECQPLTS